MKKISFLAIISFLLLTNSYAMKISHGKLISHKEFSNGNAKVQFLDITSSNQDILKLQRKTIHLSSDSINMDDSITIESKMDNTKLVVGKSTTLKGKTDYYITNQTPYNSTYTLHTIITLHDVDGSWFNLGESVDKISLEPYGDAIISRQPAVRLSFMTQGNYTFFVTNIVKKSGQATTYSVNTSGTVTATQ